MFDGGWGDEVRALLRAGVPVESPGMGSIGYAEIAAAVTAARAPESVTEEVITRTQQYAKRQETFFRGEREAEWVDVSAPGWMEALRRLAGAQ